jgi:hypothetical protein
MNTMTETATNPNGHIANMFKALTENLFEKKNIDCDNHEFEFIDLIGSFCTKCNLAYGVECLHPNCKVHYCKKHSLSYPSLNNENTFKNVVNDMTDDIYVLHLGHDGVIDGDEKDIHKVLTYKGLKIVEYCGYYMDSDILNIFEDEKYSHITFVPIL